MKWKNIFYHQAHTLSSIPLSHKQPLDRHSMHDSIISYHSYCTIRPQITFYRQMLRPWLFRSSLITRCDAMMVAMRWKQTRRINLQWMSARHPFTHSAIHPSTCPTTSHNNGQSFLLIIPTCTCCTPSFIVKLQTFNTVLQTVAEMNHTWGILNLYLSIRLHGMNNFLALSWFYHLQVIHLLLFGSLDRRWGM